MMNKQLAAKLKTLPSGPGVYFHKNAGGEIIYVGKAAVLKNRVRQYFQKSRDIDAKTRALVAEITDVDWIETDSELDALFLEAEMVKRYMPRYNIDLRDDKSQAYVRISPQAETPRTVTLTRQPLDDRAEYIGPFYGSAAVRNALRILRKSFPYYAKKSEVGSALLLQLGLIPDDNDNYNKDLKKLSRILRGGRAEIIKEVENEMKAVASEQNFELAATLRNKLYNLNELKKQIIFGREEFLDISKDQALADLKKLLNLKTILRRIEAYDVSHISGTNNVASMVVATNGVADKRGYRKFKLRAGGNDDYAHMRETIERRLKHLRDWGRPDLVIIDGGKGQLNAVAGLLRAEKIPFIGRNKGGDHSRNAQVVVVVPRGDSYEEILLEKDDHIAKLIARLDDESHRFAVSYHQTLRGKSQTKNALEEIPGIGPATRKQLIRKFGSVAGVKNASNQEIAAIIGQAKARIIEQNMVQ